MKEIFQFLKMAERLKYEKRDIKLSNGEYESVAAHTWMMSLFALLFHDKMFNRIDIGHALKIIVVHDLVEAITGDQGLAEQDSPAKKHAAEEKALQKLIGGLSPSKQDEIYALYYEYANISTPEGRFAKACDKLEAAAQATFFGSVKYWEEHGDPDFYYDYYVNRRRREYWQYEPAFNEFAEFARKIALKIMADEGVDPKKYQKKGKQNEKI